VAFVQLFRRRKKVGSYPVCVQHAIFAYGFQEIGQDWARSGLAQMFGIRKGSIPRTKVSLTE
jgi:hypothetical protein